MTKKLSVEIERNVRIGEHELALVVTTKHGHATATTAVHRQDFKRRIGGARFVSESNAISGGRAEVASLATEMTDKCLAANIPADGQKTIVVAPADRIGDNEYKANLLAEHIRVVATEDPGVIFGPDMNVPEAVQNLIAQRKDLLDHVTGLSEAMNGLSIDDKGLTAMGLIVALEALLSPESVAEKTVSVQGFGAVGAHAAKLAEAKGARVVAVSNVKGVLYSSHGYGLPIQEIFDRSQREGEETLQNHWNEHRTTSSFQKDPNALFGLSAQIFIPAARTKVLAMQEELERVRLEENPQSQSVEKFLADSGVEIVVEGANHPLTRRAEEYLAEKGVKVLPGIIANCAGLIGCWIEWQKRSEGAIGSPAQVQDMQSEAKNLVVQTVTKNVKTMRRKGGVGRKAAAKIVEYNREKLLPEGK